MEEQRIITEYQFIEFKDIMLTDKLGYGVNREVYAMRFDDTKVVKIAKDNNGRMSNVLEFEIWNGVKETKFEKHFARCYYISDCGNFLVMHKATLKDKSKYPEKVPSFFNDRKYKNYGFIGNRFVAIDYANFSLINGFKNTLKKADWWGDEPEYK